MSAPIVLNSLITKADAVITAATENPTKGTPVVDLMSYQVIAGMMHLHWQYEEDVIATEATFTADKDTDIFTVSTHGFRTGIKVRVSNAGGALPTGLAAATDYYVSVINANTFYLCESYYKALNVDYINITTNGTGTNTVTPQAVKGTAGEGVYEITIPGGYEIDTNFISVGTTTHSNIVGQCSVIDSAGTAVDLAGYVTAYTSTTLAMVVDKAFVAHNNLGIDATDKPVKYSLKACFPVTGRNYVWEGI